MADPQYLGTLKIYDPIKGFGFITRPEGRDVFVFFSDFSNGGDANALPGCQVKFNIEIKGTKGPRAKNVTVVG